MPALSLCIALLMAAPVAFGQVKPIAVPDSAFSLTAYQTNGARFDLDRLRGNVTVVFFWDSNCAVCLNKLPELRANLTGWRNKSFALLAVNVDKKPNDWLAYEDLFGKLQVPIKGYYSVRQSDALETPVRLPLTLVVDAKGKIVQRISGRVAPEVWDTVADMLN